MDIGVGSAPDGTQAEKVHAPGGLPAVPPERSGLFRASRVPGTGKGVPRFDHASGRPPDIAHVSQARRHLISDPRVNEQIRISPVRLIDADGEQVGIVSLDKAREMADQAELDLVEVADRARPPVVKIMDWGRYRYEQQKKAKEARKNQQTQETKEIQLRPRTDDHDFQTKLRRARGFLEEGNAVRVVLRFRGRELRRPEVGVETLERMLESTKDIAQVEQLSKRIEGRRLVARLEPLNSG
ncbi:MAG: translation initiation factor IF-3 [Gemmatimonadales bacterium]|nr:MAG: translation initiation factor IF-3 [Gemmatimonadales bacterium]